MMVTSFDCYGYSSLALATRLPRQLESRGWIHMTAMGLGTKLGRSVARGRFPLPWRGP